MVLPISTPIHYWRAALLLGVVILFSPSRASAGCGDYVVILGSGGTQHDSATSAGPGNDQHHFPPLNKPCDGPNCSNAPTRKLPPLAPTGVVAGNAKEIAQPLAAMCEEEPLFFPFDLDEINLHPIQLISSIFHPPRLD